NSTLALEFNGQIQPVALGGVKSYIEMNNNGEACFKINIENNEISESADIVYWNSPYKTVYFIDNPFVLDEPAFRKKNKYTTTNISFVNESRIVTHDNKLKFVLNFARPMSIFEEGVIDERYKLIKEKIDAILPGEFTVKDGERFYVNDNVKLNAGNLATGSKMFSIIKILLERGEIDENTLLILDEPESHLHPKWQNLFVEIMILLVKEIGCHVLLTTHSSHFMLAVDAYMRKYNITDLCNFYQTEYIGDGPFVSYKCVNDSLNLIYEDFVTYLSDIKLMRNQSLLNDDVE
ncbi:MAG: ATP-binding protein, partial [Lachnospiraceae bacterium]|nr:ATP-binding protein [Lachnospiraceae bacterium]